jgi:hypothetical protein
MLAGEFLAEAVGLGIDDEIDVALPMQSDILAAVFRGGRKTQPLEQGTQQLGIFGGVFDELETIGAEWIVTVAHAIPRERN